MQRTRAVVSADGFQCRSDVISLRVPAGKTGFKGRIGNAVDAVRDVEDLNIIEQALAFAKQPDLEIVDGPAVVTLSIVEPVSGFDGCPRGFAGFVAVGPVRRQTMI